MTNLIRSLVTQFAGFICVALFLVSISGCGTGLTPVEQAEVDKYIAEYGRDAMVRCLKDLDVSTTDEKTYRKYVKYFTSQGANVNAEDSEYRTPLIYAAGRGDLNVVQFLISKGANINASDVVGKTPLHNAARCGRLEVVKFLVSNGAYLNAMSMEGGTPLSHSIWGRNANIEVVEFLVSHGADVNAGVNFNYGDAPLECAMNALREGPGSRGSGLTREQSIEVIKLLVSKGADVSAALALAKRNGESEIIIEILSRGSGVEKEVPVMGVMDRPVK
ncbi:MAG: ankyrin repeat domain-containing protein [Planctomycetaceae bacterium]|jgi:ankyrin repeat protein|nr:ankyrin repeat domain-containing protein [Planctomycetaceae bacterium]